MASLLTFTSVPTTVAVILDAFKTNHSLCECLMEMSGVIDLFMALQGVKDLSILDGACFTWRMASKHDTDECERLEMLQEL